MKSQYDRPVRFICGDNWETDQVSLDERDGGYGIGICLAYLQGCPPRLDALADTLGTPPYILEVAYKRLHVNGFFSAKCPLNDSTELKMHHAKTEDEITACAKAWCHIAGLASGLTGKGRPRQDMINAKKQVYNG